MTEIETGEAGGASASLPPSPPPPPPPMPAPAPATPARRGGFWAGLLGGVLATGAGLGAVHYVPGLLPAPDTAALEAALAAGQKETAALKAELAALSRPGDLETRLAALEAQASAPPAGAIVDLAPLDAGIVALDARLSALESLPPGEGAPAVAIAQQDAALRQMQAQIAALQTASTAAALSPEAEAQIKAATEAMAAFEASAAAATTAIAQTAALGRLQAAIDSGAPFANALPVLGAVPPALTDLAGSGVPTLAALQAGFPDAARAALAAALQADMGASWTDRAANFLRSQTGVRSLAPREGADPDAILSRAEAALAAGDLATALTELAALPEPAAAALADWRKQADQRQAALAAVADLSGGLGQ